MKTLTWTVYNAVYTNNGNQLNTLTDKLYQKWRKWEKSKDILKDIIRNI